VRVIYKGVRDEVGIIFKSPGHYEARDGAVKLDQRSLDRLHRPGVWVHTAIMRLDSVEFHEIRAVSGWRSIRRSVLRGISHGTSVSAGTCRGDSSEGSRRANGRVNEDRCYVTALAPNYVADRVLPRCSYAHRREMRRRGTSVRSSTGRTMGAGR
jgi:hypothetical protein